MKPMATLVTRSCAARVPLLLVLVLVLAFGPGAVSPDELRQQLDHIFSHQDFRDLEMSLRVVSATTGQVLYSYHGDQALIPASNVKLFTTAAALHHLGADYRFRTVVAATGPIDGRGVLDGDLVVVGGGDPSISGRFYGGKTTAVFEEWAKELRGRGLRTVTGDLIGDDRFFDRQWRHPDWPAGQAAYWYEAPIGALSLNDNCVNFTLTPTQPGRIARLSLAPATGYLDFRNACVTTSKKGPPNVLFKRATGSRQVVLEGSIPKTVSAVTNYVTVDEPGEYFLTVLAEVLRQHGITIRGRVRLVAPEENLPSPVTLMEHRSSLLSAVRVANKRSQNFYAEQILKTTGRELVGRGSFEGGTQAVLTFLADRGLESRQVSLADGCGLSRRNRLSAQAITDLLVLMARGPHGDVFVESLAEAGVDGSMRRRVNDPEFRGRIFGKTGTLARVRALSGYVRSQRGELLVYSFLMNGKAAGYWQARQAQDEALKVLARY